MKRRQIDYRAVFSFISTLGGEDNKRGAVFSFISTLDHLAIFLAAVPVLAVYLHLRILAV